LIVTSVLRTFVEAREDVLLRPRLWRDGAMLCVLVVFSSECASGNHTERNAFVPEAIQKRVQS
jgi:hypothetical protein